MKRYSYPYTPTADEMRAVREIRKARPELRRTCSTAIESTGGRRTVYNCVCGASHTVSTDYRQAKHLREWREEHAGCARLMVSAKANQETR